MTPRVWVGRFQFLRDTPMEGERTLTGFTEQVRLGDLGEILESADLVMQVSLLDAATSRPLNAARLAALMGGDDPLFRGVVLSHYADGQWSPAEITLDASAPMTEEIDRNRSDLIQQEIRLQPIGTQTLFVLDPGLACIDAERERHGGIRRDLITGVFRRQPRGHNDEPWTTNPFVYRAWSWKGGRGSSAPVWFSRRLDLFLTQYRDDLLRLPRSLGGLRELADQIIDQSLEEGARTPAAIARELEGYLRDSGQFNYTLSLSIQDPTIDPVEDFLFNRKQGHCEYFASALALMLRAAGIPSRLISGFKGGDLNEKTGRYEVRQLHAHAWVEAWVDDQWLVFDPTPSGRDATLQAMASTGSYLWTDWNNRMKSAWNAATMLTPQQQQALFYDPAVGGLKSWWSNLQTIRPDLDRMKEFVASLRSPRQWFSWRGGVAAFVLGVLIAGMILGGRRALKQMRRRWGRSLGPGSRHERIVVPFFERFCRIAAHAGLPRPPAQTQREFTESFARQLGNPGDGGPQGWNSEQLVDAFYRIRFGREELAETDYAELNRQLDRLEGWLMNGGRSRVAS